MTEKLLSPEEIAALFEQAADGGLPGDERGTGISRSRWLRTIDWTRPAKFTPDQENRLRRGHDGFCRLATTRLAAEHRIDLDLEVIDVSQHTWFNAHRLAPANSMCAVLQVEPIGTQVLLAVELPALLVSIERLLGAPQEDEPRERKLTDIDLVLVKRVFDVLVDSLSTTWSEMADVTFSCTSIEPQAELAQLMPSSEPTLSLSMEARLGRTASTVTLLMPHVSVASVAAAFSKRAEDDAAPDAEASAALQTQLGAVDVTVRAEVGSVTLDLERVLELKPGDLLPLGIPADGDIVLCADDVVVHRARAGRSGRRRAAQIRPGGEAR